MKVTVTRGPRTEMVIQNAQKYLCEILTKEIAQNEAKFTQEVRKESQKEVS